MNLQKYEQLEFEDKGRGPKYDCWGLCRFHYYEEYQILLPSYVESYSTSQDQKEIAVLISGECRKDWIEVLSPQVGDIVTLRVLGEPWHCGVMVEPKRFLHIMRGINSCIERLTSPVWARRIDGFYRHPQLVRQAA